MGRFHRNRAGSVDRGDDLHFELGELRQQLHRYQVYLGIALAVIGLGMLLSIGLVGFYGWRLAERLWETQGRLTNFEGETREREAELSRALIQQKEELAAIRRAANEDLQAIREAHRKLASVRDPRQELSALREANEALWSELAKQRAQLLDALREQGQGNGPGMNGPTGRFRLEETRYLDPDDDPSDIKGFVRDDKRIRRATAAPANPAHLLIELTPEEVQIGGRYELAVRLVNRSNAPLEAAALRIDWSFGGRNTGGSVPLAAVRVDARQTAVLYETAGQWTPAHETGPVSLTATLTLVGGASIENTLRW